MTEFSVCTTCGNKNNVNAKFCSNCGSKMILPEEKKYICKSCGLENDPHVHYCASCGSKLSRRSSDGDVNPENRKSQKERTPSSKISKRSLNPLIIGSLIVGIFIIYLFIDNNKQNTSSIQSTVEKKTKNIELENNVYEVASKFVCACTSCAEEPLESCSCQTAQEERQFIRQALQQGQSVDEVITAVNMNYGWIKDEYKPKYGNGKLSLDVNSKLNDLTVGETTNQGVEQLAKFADRGEIIFHFVCPCGKCDDELKVCDCDHPKGAQEVKQFIDEKIRSGKYTIDKIIEFVDHKYNNRIALL